MELRQSHTLLLVDDEESITKSLYRLFRKEKYNIITASGGQEALEILKKTKDLSLIISDQRMPGMTGAQFLEKAKVIFPNAVRFLLTGYSDMDAIVDAVNKGEIHRYLSKPWNDKDLILQVRQALEHYELQFENNRLTTLTNRQKSENEQLEQGIMDAMRLINSLVEKLNPALDKYMMATTALTREIASEFHFSKESLHQLEIASMIYDIGLLELPRSLVLKAEEEMTDDEFSKFVNHPVIGKMCIQSIQGFEEASEFIAYHHENYDGSGFPRGLMGDEIPLGARILAAAAEYCRIRYTWPRDINEIAKKAKDYFGSAAREMMIDDPDKLLTQVGKKIILLRSGQKYDIEVVSTLIKILNEKEREASLKEEQIVQIDIDELSAGMTLGKNLRSSEGRVLLRRGTRFKAQNIETMKELVKRGIIERSLYILAGQEDMAKLRELKMEKIREQERTVHMPYDKIKEGMVLGKNVRTSDGRLLFSKGVSLNGQAVEKIQELIENGKLSDNIYILT